ncbi:uncharacterized protein BJ212DRAFT_1278610 [Suillus subaureus]|uniref:F-box domain-containing protein n=1 Tax=Suillus subaureus TaxID=48587 RepID=A0A9P7E4T3_9AGAM|nr:uncharacterized protein BJ212DRAFT_1278610 [Suillus subaureus]KAG1810894.1 hypothetical protein BJ212DRAFT_1278610 [Suillus subaureus]
MSNITTMALPPEACHRIVHWTRRCDLTALCLTSKSLQKSAEIKLYEVIMSGDINVIFRACESIVSQERLGPYVRSFYLYQNARRTQTELPTRFWNMIQKALWKMRCLDVLYIDDPARANTWILSDIPKIPFQLREANFRLPWNRHIIKFLESQNKLRQFQFSGGIDEDAPQFEDGSLPDLCTFDGHLASAMQLLSLPCGLRHLRIPLDRSTNKQLLDFIPNLTALSRTLRSLNIIHMPEELSVEAIKLISFVCPDLHYVGIIQLPMTFPHRSMIHDALLAMHNLRDLEVDVSRWSPLPNTGSLQRMLATELHTYCPSIEHIIFRTGSSRILWYFDGNEWNVRSENGQHLLVDGLWKSR